MMCTSLSPPYTTLATFLTYCCVLITVSCRKLRLRVAADCLYSQLLHKWLTQNKISFWLHNMASYWWNSSLAFSIKSSFVQTKVGKTVKQKVAGVAEQCVGSVQQQWQEQWTTPPRETSSLLFNTHTYALPAHEVQKWDKGVFCHHHHQDHCDEGSLCLNWIRLRNPRGRSHVPVRGNSPSRPVHSIVSNSQTLPPTDDLENYPQPAIRNLSCFKRSWAHLVVSHFTDRRLITAFFTHHIDCIFCLELSSLIHCSWCVKLIHTLIHFLHTHVCLMHANASECKL